MNKEQQIEFIRQKCIEANRDIVALKFGCEVTADVFGEWDVYTVLAEVMKCKRHKNASTCDNHDCYGDGNLEDAVWLLKPAEDGPFDFTVVSDRVKEIYGRPIRLTDVLLAMVEKSAFTQWAVMRTNNVADLLAIWNFRADDLREQNADTIAFAHHLLQ